MWQRKPTGGRALTGVTTAVSPSVPALRSEQGRDMFPRVVSQPEKGRTTLSSDRTLALELFLLLPPPPPPRLVL